MFNSVGCHYGDYGFQTRAIWNDPVEVMQKHSQEWLYIGFQLYSGMVTKFTLFLKLYSIINDILILINDLWMLS